MWHLKYENGERKCQPGIDKSTNEKEDYNFITIDTVGFSECWWGVSGSYRNIMKAPKKYDYEADETD